MSKMEKPIGFEVDTGGGGTAVQEREAVAAAAGDTMEKLEDINTIKSFEEANSRAEAFGGRIDKLSARIAKICPNEFAAMSKK